MQHNRTGWDGLPPAGTAADTPHWLSYDGHTVWAWWSGTAWHLGGLGVRPDGLPRLSEPLIRERLGDWAYVGPTQENLA